MLPCYCLVVLVVIVMMVVIVVKVRITLNTFLNNLIIKGGPEIK
jgi:hypothetical protein